MATFKFGKDLRLKVSDMGTTPIFTQVGGEGTLTINATTDKIDISSKDDGNIKSMATGQSELTIAFAGVCNTPDTGLTNLDTAYKAGTPVNITVVRGATTIYAGSVFVGNKKVDASNNQAMKWSFDLWQNGAATTDVLFT